MGMSSFSTARRLDEDDEIVRLGDDPADEDANAAPTKVGPMSKAFVDQLMFKAQLAESAVPSSRPISSRPPASTTQPKAQAKAQRADTPPPPPPPPPPAAVVPVTAPFHNVPAPEWNMAVPQPGPAPTAAVWIPVFAHPSTGSAPAPRDWDVAIQVSVVLTSLVLVVAGAGIFLFP
jgi:hypothetical protein